MNIAAPFIQRPVMTILLMVALVLAGVIGYVRLAVSELPTVDFPTISVSASLPGADAETMAAAVATPLEKQFSTIAGVDVMTSSSSLGATTINIQFALDRDIDAAAQDVQTAISAAQRRLPDEMTDPPTFRKVNPSESAILYIAMSSDTLPLTQVNDYAESQLARRLSTLDGVADVSVFGSQKYAVRLQMDADALARRGIGLDEVVAAAKAANVNQPTGSLYGATRAMPLQADGQLATAEEFSRQIVLFRDGAPVRLGDIGKVVDSVASTQAGSWFNGDRTVILAVKRQPGANTIEVVNRIREQIPAFEQGLPPTVSLQVFYDRSQTIRASVEDVQFTLILAAVLVVMVIFLFLRNLSATLIPSLALPIAVVATFAGMAVLGFSLDNLSLMALTLSVGFVVDDAIVMLENIVRHVENGEAPREAAFRGAREVGFTILSMTISLAAVFIPVLFMGGMVGRLLNEFAVTIVLAIVVSGFISVTLTPMLCSRLLKPHSGTASHGLLFRWSEDLFNHVQGGYERSLLWSMRHQKFIFLLFLASIGASVWLFQAVGKDFLPADDSGRLIANTEGAAGTSFAEMARHQNMLAEIVRRHPDVAGVMSTVGAGGTRAVANSGMLFISLKPFAERHHSADEILQQLRPQVTAMPGINVYLQNPPLIRVGATSSKALYQYTLQGLDLHELYDWSARVEHEMASLPGFVDVTSDLDLSTPTLSVRIDRDQAARLGVSPSAIETALASAFGGTRISTLYTAIDQYDVMIEIDPQQQKDITSLSRLFVRSASGAMVPLSAVTSASIVPMAQTISHLGQMPAITLSFNLSPGVSLGDAVERLQQAGQRLAMPATIQTSLQGTAQAFQSSTSGMGWLLALAVLVVYLVLGILYESFIHPLTILSGLPSAAVGALLTLLLFGVPLSLYGFVGIIMLIGIVKKNAIMMIDFALEEQRQHHRPASEAIVQASLVRFRPIMMTTLAALMGTLPIAIGIGDGAESRQPLGLTVVGGLMLSQLLTLYITPVLYVWLDRLSGKPDPLAVPSSS